MKLYISGTKITGDGAPLGRLDGMWVRDVQENKKGSYQGDAIYNQSKQIATFDGEFLYDLASGGRTRIEDVRRAVKGDGSDIAKCAVYKLFGA